jgi:NAD(P)-dependent dehydrogenase (short-subunit alcohol dehydrogenase family)
MSKLDGKVAMVTGASSGIGAAIARGLATEGATVALVARRADRLDQVAAAIGATGGAAIPIPADVTVEAEIERVFGALVERGGQLDILVNNAGTAIRGPIDELPIEDWERVIAINLRAPFLCTRQAPRIMKRQGGGGIINIGSISVQRVRPVNATYNASKLGIDGLTLSWGMAGCAWLAGRFPATANVQLRDDGTARVASGMQDIDVQTCCRRRTEARDRPVRRAN